jgi:hypothetical protein
VVISKLARTFADAVRISAWGVFSLKPVQPLMLGCSLSSFRVAQRISPLCGDQGLRF